MALTILARLNQRPEATNDGSAVIAHHNFDTLWIDDVGENPYIYKTVDIPVAAFIEIAMLPSNVRVAAYIAAIREFFFAQRVPLQRPGKPGAFDDDSLLAYITEYNAWKAEFNLNNIDSATWTANAIAFIEGLPAFEGYPISFTLYSE